MANPVLDSEIRIIKGSTVPIKIKVWDEETPTTDMSTATATMAVYDKDGTATLTSGAATVSGTAPITVQRSWDTGSVSAGTYRAVFTVTLGAIVQIFQVAIVILPSPAPEAQ